MKKLLFMILITTLVLTGCSKKTEEVVEPVEDVQEVVGGWEERLDQEVTDELLGIFNKGTAGTEYEGWVPTKFLATQVVSGMNFKFLCENGQELVIYQDLDKDYFALNADGSVAEKAVETTQAVMLTREEVLDIAMKDAQVTETRFVEISLDREAEKLVYEVDFESSDYEYDYDIDAFSGEILWKASELDKEHFVKTDFREVAPDTPANELTDAQAKEIALKEAGISEGEISFLKIERDFDDGIKEIDVEFIANTKEYSYKLNAETGEVLEFEVDND